MKRCSMFTCAWLLHRLKVLINTIWSRALWFVLHRFKGWVTLRWRSPPIMNSREILKFDWPWTTLLSGGGLHYNQESVGEEHWTWMPTWQTLSRRLVLRRSSFLGNLKALDKKLDLRRTPTWIKYFIVFSSSRAYPPLPQITMSWAKLLHRPVHFSTLV